MASPQTETWWSNFLDLHGRDGEEEAAFLGYLVTHKIPAWAPPDQLQAAYGEFQGFVTASFAKASADPGPDAAELARQEAVVALMNRPVPQSRTAVPFLEKPGFAATRPADQKPEDPAAQQTPEFATLTVRDATPEGPPHPVIPPGAAGAPAPGQPGAPPEPGQTATDHETTARQARQGRQRGED
jgi:hypothetical protein